MNRVRYWMAALAAVAVGTTLFSTSAAAAAPDRDVLDRASAQESIPAVIENRGPAGQHLITDWDAANQGTRVLTGGNHYSAYRSQVWVLDFVGEGIALIRSGTDDDLCVQPAHPTSPREDDALYLAPCTGARAQRWEFQQVDDDVYWIVPVLNRNLAIASSNASTDSWAYALLQSKSWGSKSLWTPYEA